MYTAWCDYGATGEGMTIMVAISRTESAARNLFKSKFNDFYHPGMVVTKGIPPEMDGYIPQWVKQSVNGVTGRECMYQWYGEWHVNCS